MSVAVTVIQLLPMYKVIPVMFQSVVPVALPYSPVTLLVHVIEAIPVPLSLAVPPRSIVLLTVKRLEFVVGDVIWIKGLFGSLVTEIVVEF